MTSVHQSHQIISNMATNRTNANNKLLLACWSKRRSNPAYKILTPAVKTPNKIKNFSAQKLSSKENAIKHQLDTANSDATKRTNKKIKRNKMQGDTAVNTINVEDSDGDTTFGYNNTPFQEKK